jgi:hypothetical protein
MSGTAPDVILEPRLGARKSARRQRVTIGSDVVVWFDLRDEITNAPVAGATGVSALYWLPGTRDDESAAQPLEAVEAPPGTWKVVVPATEPGTYAVWLSIEGPLRQAAEIVFDVSSIGQVALTSTGAPDWGAVQSVAEAAAVSAALPEARRVGADAGAGAAQPFADAAAESKRQARESEIGAGVAQAGSEAAAERARSAALDVDVALTGGAILVERFIDLPATGVDRQLYTVREQGLNYRWLAERPGVGGPGYVFESRTLTRVAQDLDARINVSPGDASSDVDGVPAQFVLVNLATGRGMPLARVDGRLVHRGAAGFEVILTRAEIGDVAQQATQPVSNDLAAEAAARRALISAAAADVTVDGVPMQFLLINQRGYGMPLVGVDGRLYQRGVGRFEKVPNLADVGAAAEQAASEISGDIEAEAAARRALISTTPVDISVGGVPAQFVLVNLATGRGMPLVRVDGRLLQYGANGMETVVSRAEMAAMLANIAPAKVTPAYGFFASTSLAAPTYEQTWYIIGAYGQSNSMGRNVLTNAEDTIISTTPLYPQHALMLASGTQANGVVQTSLVPLVEASSNGGRETLLSGCVNHMIAALDAAGLTRPHFIAFTAGQSGQALTNLGRGTQGYNRFLAAVRSAADLAHAASGRPVFLWAPFIQGENETDSSITSAARHAARLERLRRHLEEDVRAITGQREPFGLIIVNTAHTGKATANPTTTLTQHRIWEAFRMLEGHPNFRFAGPMYQFPSSDVIHLSSQGQYDLGHQVGRVQTAEIFGQGWTHVRDTSHRWISATQFEVDFALPRDGDTVLLDKSGAVVSITDIPGFFGLQVVDGTESPPLITAVDATNGGYTNRTLRFTLDKAPGGVGGILLCNGMMRNAGVVEQDGPLVGARSCIRTAAGTTSLQGTTNYDWCIPFVRNLGRP